MTDGLTQAIDFSLDVQQFTQTDEFKQLADSEGHAKATGHAILKVLKDYPDADVGDDIRFPDGSRAILTNEGFRVE